MHTYAKTNSLTSVESQRQSTSATNPDGCDQKLEQCDHLGGCIWQVFEKVRHKAEDCWWSRGMVLREWTLGNIHPSCMFRMLCIPPR